MLTRIQVARRLGKSLATVRRLEGSVLHPRRDADGVHRFDTAEVEHVAKNYRQSDYQERVPGTQRQWLVHKIATAQARSALTGGNADDDEDSKPAVPPDEYEARQARTPNPIHGSAALADRLRLLEEAVENRAAADIDSRRRRERKYSEDLRELIAFANSLSDRELKAVGPEMLALLDEALSALE